MTHDRIAPEEVQYSDTIRLLDPNGRVFFYQGRVYRGIRPERVAFVARLFDEGIVERLVARGLLIGTRRTDLSLEGYGLVLEHDKLDVHIQPREWSWPSYANAATTYIELTKELCRHGLTFVDGHNLTVQSRRSPREDLAFRNCEVVPISSCGQAGGGLDGESGDAGV
ncbi:hypothetical protein ACFL59_01075 [Planctomycetota bacterium]